MTKRNSNEYISAKTDEIYIIGRSSNYNSVYVSYPTSSGRKQRWVPTQAVFRTNSYKTIRAAAYCKTYKFKSTSYSYGSISAGDTVWVYNTSGSYTRVIYPISGGYKMAWVKTSDLNGVSDQTYSLSWYQKRVGSVIANTGSYSTNLDGYKAIKGQCVWYVRNRGYEKLGKAGLTGIGGNANKWYAAAASKGKSRGVTPRTDSIACWNGGKYGHVAYVEYYDSSTQTVYFTEGNWPNSTNGVLKKAKLSSFKSHMSGYQGCIYLK